MQLEVIRTLSEWLKTEREWNELLDRSSIRVPFLRHEFLAAWWRHMGGRGEWPHGELHIVAGRYDGRLVAAAPLFATEDRQGRVLTFIGSEYAADYLDVLAEPKHLDAFCDSMLDRLSGPDASEWDAICFANLQAASPTVSALRRAAAKRGLGFRLEALDHCQVVPLCDSWQGFLDERIEKHHRHEIRRKLRHAMSQRGACWYFAGSAETFAADTADFLSLLDQHHDPRKHLAGASRAQLADIMAAAAKGGWLRLAFLEIEGRRAAAFLAFDFAGTIWVYDTAFADRFGSFSPGWVLLSCLVQWAIEEGREAVDLLRGDHAYKRCFGSVPRKVLCATIERSAAALPCDEVLAAGLGCAAIESRIEPACSCSVECEIAMVRFADGSRKHLFCKRGPAQPRGRYAPRRGLAYEAQVYDSVLRSWPRDVPELHGAFLDESSDTFYLALEDLSGAQPLIFLSRPKTAIVAAARWIARFHANESTAPEFLIRYDADFYRHWICRAAERARPVRERHPWLPAFFQRIERRLPTVLVPATIIHGEYQADNILRRDGQVVAVDWGSAALAAGEIDLASLTWGWDDDLRTACEEAYSAARWPAGACANFAVRLAAARLFLQLRWLGDDDVADNDATDDGSDENVDLDELRRLGEEFERLAASAGVLPLGGNSG